MNVVVLSVVVGPEEHGVTRHALALARATATGVERHLAAEAAAQHPAPPAIRCAQVCHWHFTDRLFGDDVTTAARRLLAMAAPRRTRHVVSFHDVPTGRQTPRQARRAAAYRAVASIADVVVVASDHERRRLRRCGIAVDAAVIPLPVPTPVTASMAPPVTAPSLPSVAVLGFVYPGKGHGKVLATCNRLPAEVEVLALGGVSPGHDALAERLARTAERAGRTFRVTGFLPDEELCRAARSVSVPVVAARAPSASASIGSWVAAGRRPVAVRNGFVDELDRRAPGLISPCRPDELADLIERALAEPASTWRDRPVPEHLSVAAVAAAHRDLYQRVMG